MGIDIMWWIVGIIGLMIIYDHTQQTRDVYGMLRYLKREHSFPPVPADAPHAAVILSLRGPDPRLPETLVALSRQDYPSFRIHVVVDNNSDPVLKDVEAVKAQCPDDLIDVSVLRVPNPTCSLKCSSLVQAVRDLNEDTEIVAFIDGDVVPHQSWLSQLVQPLLAGTADVTGGNRWYVPPSAGVGTMARYFWNAAYMTGMWAQGAPWAGTMAFRRTLAEEIGLLDAWSSAMSVDATLHRCMMAHDRTFHMVPDLIMMNQEDISVLEFHRWVTRQMAVIRYSASSTVRSAEIQVGILLLMHSLLPAITIIGIWLQEYVLAGTSAGLLFGYWTYCGCRMMLIERTMRRLANKRGELKHWLSLGCALMWFPSVTVVHYVIGTGVLIALRIRQVDWRGISYQLARNGSVNMCAYQPFGADWQQKDNHSVV